MAHGVVFMLSHITLHIAKVMTLNDPECQFCVKLWFCAVMCTVQRLNAGGFGAHHVDLNKDQR